MSQRIVVKRIVQFGKREFNEKKPKQLKVLRVKSRSILKRGILPNLQIKQIGMIHFVVIADYGEYLRAYLFTKDGDLIGADNIENYPKNTKDIEKSTDLIYKLPKVKPKLSLSDITRNYREEFEKKIKRFNDTYGLSLEFPLAIIADQNLKVKLNRDIGAKRDNKLLKITHKAYKKSIFNIISYREIFYQLLTEFIIIDKEQLLKKQIFYDLSLLLTNFYLGNQNRSIIVKLIRNSKETKICYVEFYYDLSKNLIDILDKQKNEILPPDVIYIIFQNLIKILIILRKYKILFNTLDLFLFIKQFISLFSLESLTSLKLQQTDNWLHRFYYDYYSTFLFESEKQIQKKLKFLAICFGLLSNLDIENMKYLDVGMSVQGMIDLISNSANNPIIKKEIRNSKLLISDAFMHYTFKNILRITHKTEIEKNKINISLKITNKSNYIFRDFKYNLTWKPKNRISLIETFDGVKSIDLHNLLKRKYELLATNSGKITFFLVIKFRNFINPDTFLEKTIKLTKVLIKELSNYRSYSK